MLEEKILIVDDELAVRNTLTSILEDEGYSVDSVESGEECLKAIRSENYQAVMLDVWLPGIDGVETLKKMRSIGAEPAVVMISGHGTVETAVRATKLGAFDFIEKPLSLEKIILVLRNAIRHKKLIEKHKVLKEQLQKDVTLIGNSMAVSSLRRDIEITAPTDSPILLLGENGSGKELAARMIHFQSKRSEEAFISVNCAAFEGDQLEYELFGCEPGALSFTPQGRKGKLELANEGTIFLDEISETNARVQRKIAKFLEDKEYERFGGETMVRVDVRIIAACHRELDQMVRSGKFHEDLLSRLSIVSLRIPPLRERKEDVEPLVEHFLREFSYEYGRSLKRISREAMHLLMSYQWPGNVRELKNMIERLVIMQKKDLIEIFDLPDSFRQIESGDKRKEFLPLQVALSNFEKDYLKQVLEATNHDWKKASEILKIDLPALERKVKIGG
ncbi:MAG: sigma-54 dependent transcriptional regulator [Acidobacteriota bacterium]